MGGFGEASEDDCLLGRTAASGVSEVMNSVSDPEEAWWVVTKQTFELQETGEKTSCNASWRKSHWLDRFCSVDATELPGVAEGGSDDGLALEGSSKSRRDYCIKLHVPWIWVIRSCRFSFLQYWSLWKGRGRTYRLTHRLRHIFGCGMRFPAANPQDFGEIWDCGIKGCFWLSTLFPQDLGVFGRLESCSSHMGVVHVLLMSCSLCRQCLRLCRLLLWTLFFLQLNWPRHWNLLFLLFLLDVPCFALRGFSLPLADLAWA